MVTGEGPQERAQEVLQLGIQGFFVKPVDTGARVRKVREHRPDEES